MLYCTVQNVECKIDNLVPPFYWHTELLVALEMEE